MNKLSSDLTVAALATAILAIVVVVAGAVVTIANPSDYPFKDYVQDVVILASALGIGSALGSRLRVGHVHR
jgi:hypothetical protein